MAITKPKKLGLLDDLALNFDPFAANGVEDGNALFLTVHNAQIAERSNARQIASSAVCLRKLTAVKSVGVFRSSL